MKIFVVFAAMCFVLFVECSTETNFKNEPVFESQDNLSFQDCGSETSHSNFPWLVEINGIKSSTRTCFGVVISSKSIITSAQCLDKDILLADITVTLLAQNTTIKPSGKAIRGSPEETQRMKNNIAVLNFDNEITNNNVRPICLWNKEPENIGEPFNGTAEVIGKERAEEGKIVQVNFSFKNPIDCIDNLKHERHHKYFENGQLCVEYMEANETACLKGFGAPLQLKIGDRWFLRGLYNSGFESMKANLPCAKNRIISFTDVARHLKYISEHQNSKIPLRKQYQEKNASADLNLPSCGKINSSLALDLMAKSQPAVIEDHPWLGSIFEGGDSGLIFICGGALISNKFVLTAAHCVTNRENNLLLNADNLILFFGRTYKSQNWAQDERNMESRTVDEIIAHADYKTNKANDIALIRLKTPIQFTPTILPLCIWAGSQEQSDILNKRAKVAGWGLLADLAVFKDAKRLYSANLPILNKENCKKITVLNDTRICAGYHNGTAPCNGDSGSPLVLMVNGRNYIRGIVSAGHKNHNDNTVCDPNYPVLFTDVAIFRDWIETNTA